MIKVIASDMDGTLLGNDHKVAPETLKAIHEACDAGIRFMIATGRNFKGAMEELKETDIVCDYIVGSGAEVRDQKQQIVSTAPLSMDGTRSSRGPCIRRPASARSACPSRHRNP